MKKFVVSRLPLLMKGAGIKNAVELSVRSGALQSRIQDILECNFSKIDFDTLEILAEFFGCNINSFITAEDEYIDYSFQLENHIRNNGIVYFLKRENGLTKIGWTTNLKQRRALIESEIKEKTVLTHFVSTYDCPTVEKVFHILFSEKRIEGEWFDLSKRDIQSLKVREII